ncbi:hypothetical protein F0562_032928 [Nyssa sinensis]|uniref:Large ribosomal subunit protein bL32m n=1 Tax=Nyssa sinensis TaxID=561372 RepID=A0A5J5APB0_9ASTE|nr:hypothetical protein F0562_032928 [Nyssa sinensis]
MLFGYVEAFKKVWLIVQVSPHKRGIRNGPKALKPIRVIIRCKSCGRVKLPHFYCCSGDEGKHRWGEWFQQLIKSLLMDSQVIIQYQTKYAVFILFFVELH